MIPEIFLKTQIENHFSSTSSTKIKRKDPEPLINLDSLTYKDQNMIEKDIGCKSKTVTCNDNDLKVFSVYKTIKPPPIIT